MNELWCIIRDKFGNPNLANIQWSTSSVFSVVVDIVTTSEHYEGVSTMTIKIDPWNRPAKSVSKVHRAMTTDVTMLMKDWSSHFHKFHILWPSVQYICQFLATKHEHELNSSSSLCQDGLCAIHEVHFFWHEFRNTTLIPRLSKHPASTAHNVKLHTVLALDPHHLASLSE